MPWITGNERPAPRPPTKVSTVSPGASKNHKLCKAKNITGGSPIASTKTPHKGKVLLRPGRVPVADKAVTAPANMRALSKRNLKSVWDSVSVAGCFESQSRCSAVSSDTTVWTGEADGSIVIRLAPSGMAVRRIDPMGRSVVHVLANAKGKMWAGYSDGTIRVFDHATQKVLLEATQHTAAVYAMCAADGFVFTGGADWKVYQWEADDLHFTRMYHGHRNNVRCLTTYRDPESAQRYVVSGSDDGTVKIWDASASVIAPAKKFPANAEDAGCVATLDGQGRAVLSMLVLEDTAELWVGSEDTAIRVWDLYSMTITSVITAHRAPVVSMQRVEETIWSGSKDNMLVITSRFTKDVVYQAGQPQTSNTNVAQQQRFIMSIQPVTRTVVYNVWATGPDGSWQCWHFSAPENSAPYTEEAPAYSPGHYLSQSRHHHTPSNSQRRSGSARAALSPNMNSDSHQHNYQSSTVWEEEDAELRESVSRTRRSVEELLTKPAEVTVNSNSMAGIEVDAKDNDIPIKVIAASIRNDRAAETKKDVEHQQAALLKADKHASALRSQLEKLGRNPDPVVAAAAADKLAARQSGVTGSPNTQALESVSAKLEAQRAENAAMAAAIKATAK